jgi:tellurium resistance protein TerZ
MPVSLTKGQKISLEKESGGGNLTQVIMGLGWDAKKLTVSKRGLFGSKTEQVDQEIDLDATCLLFDEAKKLLDVVWFQQLQSRDGSIRHTGDNRTGAGDGDDEQIIVNLNAVPTAVKYLVFTVNSFTGQTFEQIENAFCRLVNGGNGSEIARYNLSGGGSHTAQIMAKLYRHNNEWKMHAIGENASGRTFLDMLPLIVSQL